jgi:hypothetical protein
MILGASAPFLATRVRHLLYVQFFPFARWQETRSGITGACSFDEGVVRFDGLQFLLPRAPGLELAPVKIAKKVQILIHNLLWVYLHSEPTAELIEMREFLRSVLPKAAEPSGG